MRKGFIIDYETVAAHLANEEAKIQAGFVATFLKELRQAAGTAYNTEMQLCWVNKELSKADREVLKMLSYTDDKPD